MAEKGGLEEAVELSKEQLTVLEMLSRGLKEEAIAKETYVTVHTVKYHKKVIFYKLEVKSTVEAVIKALRLGIISIKKL